MLRQAPVAGRPHNRSATVNITFIAGGHGGLWGFHFKLHKGATCQPPAFLKRPNAGDLDYTPPVLLLRTPTVTHTQLLSTSTLNLTYPCVYIYICHYVCLHLLAQALMSSIQLLLGVGLTEFIPLVQSLHSSKQVQRLYHID